MNIVSGLEWSIPNRYFKTGIGYWNPPNWIP